MPGWAFRPPPVVVSRGRPESGRAWPPKRWKISAKPRAAATAVGRATPAGKTKPGDTPASHEPAADRKLPASTPSPGWTPQRKRAPSASASGVAPAVVSRPALPANHHRPRRFPQSRTEPTAVDRLPPRTLARAARRDADGAPDAAVSRLAAPPRQVQVPTTRLHPPPTSSTRSVGRVCVINELAVDERARRRGHA